MGQSSSPLLNKYGSSMYWNSMWDSKLLFTKKLKEDIFINMFLPLIFNKSLSTELYKLNKKNLYYYNSCLHNSSKEQFNLLRNDFNLKKSFLSNPNSTSLNTYYISGKIWILRYQKWLVLIFSIYTPKYATNIAISRLQLVKNSRKKDSKWWFFLKNYSDSLVSNKYDRSFLKSSIFLKKKPKRFFIGKKIKLFFFKKFNKINSYLKSRIFLIKLKKKKVLERRLFFFLKKIVRLYKKELKLYRYKDLYFKKRTKPITKSLRRQLEVAEEKKNDIKFQSWQIANQLNFYFNENNNKLNFF